MEENGMMQQKKVSMSYENSYERRRVNRLTAESDFRNTSWAYPATSLVKMLLRKRYAASILDISGGGIGIITNKNVKIGGNLELTICYKEFTPFVVNCRVRSSRVSEEHKLNGKTVYYYLVGLQLELCSNETMSAIRKIIQLIHLSKKSAIV